MSDTPTSTTQPSHRKVLNKDQLNVLYTLYKFRFGTTDLLRLTQSKSISRQYMNTRLKILCEQEYIGRRYDSGYRLQAKFAQYYLLPKGIAILKPHPEHFSPSILRNIRRDEKASDRMIRHSINIFMAYAKLRELYVGVPGSDFYFYTKSYITGDKAEGFPSPLPDAFMSFKSRIDQNARNYIIEYFDDTMPHSVMKQRIGQLVDHADSEEWVLTKEYPNLLLVCETERLRRLAIRWADAERERGWSDDLRIEAKTLADL